MRMPRVVRFLWANAREWAGAMLLRRAFMRREAGGIEVLLNPLDFESEGEVSALLERIISALSLIALLAPHKFVRKHAGETTSGNVTINTESAIGDVFETSSAFLGALLAHESEHVEQQTGWGGFIERVIYSFGTNGMREAQRLRLENAAYAYECANAKTKSAQACKP